MNIDTIIDSLGDIMVVVGIVAIAVAAVQMYIANRNDSSNKNNTDD